MTASEMAPRNGPGDERVLQDLAPDWDAYLAHYRDAAGAKAIGEIKQLLMQRRGA